MNTRRRLVIALGAGALTAPFASFAQQPPARVARIGFLGSGSMVGYESRVEALRAGLRDFGYVEGKNLVLEYRWAEGKFERLPGLAAELVQLKVDVIVTQTTPATRAAKAATATIPIVMAGVGGDPIASGFVASLARPNGNITGMTSISGDLSAKRLELLKGAFPSSRRVVFLTGRETTTENRQLMDVAAKSRNVELQQIDVRDADEIADAFSAMSKRGVDGVVVHQTPLLFAHAGVIGTLAARHRIPSVGVADFAEVGGLMGYGIAAFEMFRGTARFVDRLLKGAKPADLPIEQPTKFELVINMKTAKAIGVKLPQSILVRADRLIE